MFAYEQPIKASFSKRLSFELSLHFYQKSVGDTADGGRLRRAWGRLQVGLGAAAGGHKASFRNAGHVLKLDCSDGCTALKFTCTK